MQVGGYTLDLYCDAKGCKQDGGVWRAQAQFSSESGSSCRQAARRAGWRLFPNGDTHCRPCRQKLKARALRRASR